MRLSTCIAASFALLSVIVVPMSAHAQLEPRSLTSEELTFVRAFDEAMKNATDNRLVQNTYDWVKAAHAQEICQAFDSGSSVDDVTTKMAELSSQLEDEALQQDFMQYASGIIIVGTRSLCPEYTQMVNQYLQSP
jgi:hypothetical protein